MTANLSGLRILVAEDDYFIATDIARALRARGAEIIGPASNVDRALELADGELDGAVLDINLGGRMAFAVADALCARGIPFVFATGYDHTVIPEGYSSSGYFEKPFDFDRISTTLDSACRNSPS